MPFFFAREKDSMHDVNPGLSQVFLTTRDLYRAVRGLDGSDSFTVKHDEAQQQA